MEEGEKPKIGQALTEPPALAANREPLDLSGTTYSPALEWPGDPDMDTDTPSITGPTELKEMRAPASSLRLLVQHSPVLHKSRKLALLDGFSEIQFGRDAPPPDADTPRIRLKELEVSKLHATVFWDQERSRWSIVDMGSKHGTFIQSTVSSASAPSSSAEGSDERGLRLSSPRVASIPRTLSHLDRLTIGGTVFAVHIHDYGRPCAECSPQAGEEIPLFSHQSTRGDFSTAKKRRVDATTAPDNCVPEAVRSRDPKKALAMLKRSLLSSQESSSTSTSSIQTPRYVDRSARRRALHPDHTPMTGSGTGSSKYPSPSATAPPTPPASAPVSAPSVPLPSSNIGHRLLMRQGWTPGSALGDPENGGLVAPLEPPSTIGRTGLGVPARASTSTTAPQDGDWRDAGKKRRWADFGGNGGHVG